jgi:saccharopine dehydrogenase (NAD+, L-lysine forming)
MLKTIIRREHKNHWERRVALTPAAVTELRAQGLDIVVENSPERIFSNEQYANLDIPMVDTPEHGEFVVGIKEPPVKSIMPNQVHLAFSHTIKGQPYNMGLLQKFIDQKASLFDYETIKDSTGKRTIAFGRFAGIAGAADSFYVLGKKLALKGLVSDISKLKQTVEYGNCEALRASCQMLNLKRDLPIRVLIVGTGNVGKGSEEVCQWLNLPKVDINQLIEGNVPEGSWYAVASSRHINARHDGQPFEMKDFVENGVDAYYSTFDKLLGSFNVLLQTPYWTEKYPRHLDVDRMKAFEDKLPLVIGDISCDIHGSLACTHKESTIGEPAFTYLVNEESIIDEINWSGPTVMSIDNLPCELSSDASEHFSGILKDYVPHIMKMNLNDSFEALELIPLLKDSMIVYNGKLTPNYQYLQPFLEQHNAK